MWSTVNRQPSILLSNTSVRLKNQRDGKNHPSDFERKTGLELALRASFFSAIPFFTPPNPLKGGTKGPSSESCFHLNKKRQLFELSFSVEPKPRFELGTPSLRVKCSTAELFRRCGILVFPFRCANIRKKIKSHNYF